MATDQPVTRCFCGAVKPYEHCAPHCPRMFDRVMEAAAPGPVKSDGGSSAYYKLPPSATDLMDLIEAEEMSFARGNMFKALFRLGKKAGTDVEYDLNKLQWFLDRMREMHAKGQRL